MTDIIIKGKIVIKDSNVDKFLEDLTELLEQHDAYLHGSIMSYEFDECEVIEPIEEVKH